MTQDDWISADKPPKAKEQWNHTEQCLVWYESSEYPNKVDCYGIAYYNYEPPFKSRGEWVDFANYGRQPKFWQPLPKPPIK